jgi:hypothetical protein
MKEKALLTILLCFGLFPKEIQAKGKEVFLARYAEESIELNGETADWLDAGYPGMKLKGDSIALGKEGWEDEDDFTVKVYLAYDDQSLMIGLSASDDKHVRTKVFEPDEDHLELWIKTPSPDGDDIKVMAYFPGRKFPTFKGGVRWLDPKTGKSKPVKGAKFYEKTGSKGWEAEIVVPWKSMPAIWKKLPSTKWAVAAVDCDNYHVRTRETVLATAWGGDEGPMFKRVKVEDIETVAEAFLGSFKTKPASKKRLYADVARDDREEVIYKVDATFAIFGHGFKDGQGYVYIDIPVASPSDIEQFEMKDVTGDGRTDFVFRYKQYGEGWVRRMMAVYSFRGEDVGRVFAQDLERKVGTKSATSKAEIIDDAVKGKAVIKVTAGEVKGWTESSFKLETEMDVQGVIAPWDEEQVKYYLYLEGGFESQDAGAMEKLLAAPKKVKKKKKKKKK